MDKATAIENQVKRFNMENANKAESNREAKLLAQSASLPAIQGGKQAPAGGNFVAKNEGTKASKRAGLRRRSFGSTRDLATPSGGNAAEKLPSLDRQGGTGPSGPESTSPMATSQRVRGMRKTLEPGSVKFDVGLTVSDLKENGKKRDERRTAAKEKRAATAAARAKAAAARMAVEAAQRA